MRYILKFQYVDRLVVDIFIKFVLRPLKTCYWEFPELLFVYLDKKKKVKEKYDEYSFLVKNINFRILGYVFLLSARNKRVT